MANTKITSRVIADDAILTANIADDQITSALIADDVALGGNPTTSTQTAGNNTTRIATTAFVSTAVANIVNSAPATLDTLGEIATALNNDAALNTTLTNSIATKAPLASPTFTGDVDIDATDDLRLRFLNGSTFKAGIQVPTSTGDMISGSAVNDLAIRSQANMLFSTGGNTERVRIDSAGNVGIGRTPTAYGSFRVLDLAGSSGAIQKLIHTGSTVELQSYASSTVGAVGTATSHPLLFTTGDTEKMRIASDGKVGIGTTSPSAKLDVRDGGGSSDPTLSLVSNTSTPYNHSINALNPNLTAGEANIIVVGREGATNNAGYLGFKYAADGDNSNLISLGHWGNNFQLNVTGNGRVGIGTESPDGELHVESSGNGDVYVERTSGAKIHLQAQSALGNIGTASNHDLGFMTNASVRMRIKNDGNVGINSNATNAKLEVVATSGEVFRADSNNGAYRLVANQTGVNMQGAVNILGTTLIDGLSNYTGLTVKGSGGSRPMIQWSNANNGALCAIYGTEGNDMVLTSGSSNTERMRIASDGRVAVGTSTVAEILTVSSTGNSYWALKLDMGTSDYGLQTVGSGSYAIGILDAGVGYRGRWQHNGTLYTQDGNVHDIDSDERLKEEITDCPSQWSLIKDLPLQRFKWKDKRNGDTFSYGWIAQPTKAKYPEFVEPIPQPKEDIDAGKEDPEYLTVKSGDIQKRSIAALQEAMARIEALEAEVAALKG